MIHSIDARNGASESSNKQGALGSMIDALKEVKDAVVTLLELRGVGEGVDEYGDY